MGVARGTDAARARRHVLADADDPGRTRTQDGWTWLLLVTASRAYLAIMATLVACAVLPVVLGWQGHVIRSGSMEPHIGVGDVVLSVPLPDSSPVPVGRVVSFLNPAAADGTGEDTMRMHRIVSATDEHTFITKGDANRDADSTPISREQITGQARLLVPWVGLPTTWVNAGDLLRLGLWLAVSMAAVLMAALSVPRRRRADDNAGDDDAGDVSGTTGHGAEQAPAHAGTRRPGLVVTMTAAVGLLLAPLILPVGAADAAFTAHGSNAGNSFTVAVNASTAKSTYQVYDSTGTDGWIDSSSVYVSISATSGSGTPSISYSVNGGTPVTSRSTYVLFNLTQQGDNTLTYFATDNLGRAENQHTVHVKLDGVAPAVAVTSRATDSTHAQWRTSCTAGGSTGAFCGTAIDASSGVASLSYTLSRGSDSRCFNGTTWTTTACGSSYPAALSGSQWSVPVPDATLTTARTLYRFSITAVDVAGNQSAATARTFYIG